MIKSFFTSHLSSAAASEGVIIALKLADTETHGLRLFAAGLLLASLAILTFHWHHKEKANASTMTATPAKRPHKNSKPSRRR